MYDKDTIISAFDKRGTLVQWLKNLDETLKNSTLVRIEKVETNEGFVFKFVFANGVEMLTPTVEIIKSAKIEGGVQNDTFKITLTLSDGSIISSDDFKAPVHISEINVTEITAISQASDGFTVETKMFTDINGRMGINDILVYQMPIKGSDSISVNVDGTGKSAEIHLNTDILNDIARALKAPASAPTSTEIVAVDNTGTQAMLAVGDGLSIENGVLKSTGGGGFKTWKKITVAELYTMLNVSNVGRQVMFDYIGSDATISQLVYTTPVASIKPYFANNNTPSLSTEHIKFYFSAEGSTSFLVIESILIGVIINEGSVIGLITAKRDKSNITTAESTTEILLEAQLSDSIVNIYIEE